jgi:hypothetical protein
MRFSLQPEPRPEQSMKTLSIDEIVEVFESSGSGKPALENYFSPDRKDHFIKEFLHFLNTSLLEIKQGELDPEKYIMLVLLFQFVAPLLEIPTEKELGLFYRLVLKRLDKEDIDMSLHFVMEEYSDNMVKEEEALQAFRNELDASYEGHREAKASVQKRLKKDAQAALSLWQREKEVPALATAFGRSIVIPSFFSFTDKKLNAFYKHLTEGITYRMWVPFSDETE